MRGTSPEATGKPNCTFVDTAFAFDKGGQGLFQTLKFGSVPQQPEPLAAGSKIHLVGIRGALDYSRERFPHFND